MSQRQKEQEQEQQISDDEKEILVKCSNLKLSVEKIKSLKKDAAVKQFAQQEHTKLQASLSESILTIQAKYSQQRNALQLKYSAIQMQNQKAIQSIQKSIQNYAIILQDLSKKMEQVEEQYLQVKNKCEEAKNQIAAQWIQQATTAVNLVQIQ